MGTQCKILPRLSAALRPKFQLPTPYLRVAYQYASMMPINTGKAPESYQHKVFPDKMFPRQFPNF